MPKSEGSTDEQPVPANETTNAPEVVVVNDQTLVKWTPKAKRVERPEAAKGRARARTRTAAAPTVPPPARGETHAPVARASVADAERAFRVAAGTLLVARGIGRARAILDELEASILAATESLLSLASTLHNRGKRMKLGPEARALFRPLP